MENNTSRQSDYQPDTATHPGELLAEYLKAYGMTQVELAERTGLSQKVIHGIVRAKAPVTADTAIKLHRIFDKPSHFWDNLQRNYDSITARQAEQQRLQDNLGWLKKFPVAHMVKTGWITKHQNQADQLDSVLQFFGIASPDQWEVASKIAYRQSARSDVYPLSAWLRRGEIEAFRMNIPTDFDQAAFMQVLSRARALTQKPPEVFQPKLIQDCAKAGVALVFVPELPKAKVSGCTRWIDGKAIIQLSLHYKSNDQLWFTFFHEAGHIIKHGRKKVFLEGNGVCEDKEEKEADIFARDMLIPPGKYQEFLSEMGFHKFSQSAIRAFAGEIGIAPGIVVGRLQHDEKIPFSRGNNLKIRYQWVEEQV